MNQYTCVWVDHNDKVIEYYCSNILCRKENRRLCSDCLFINQHSEDQDFEQTFDYHKLQEIEAKILQFQDSQKQFCDNLKFQINIQIIQISEQLQEQIKYSAGRIQILLQLIIDIEQFINNTNKLDLHSILHEKKSMYEIFDKYQEQIINTMKQYHQFQENAHIIQQQIVYMELQNIQQSINKFKERIWSQVYDQKYYQKNYKDKKEYSIICEQLISKLNPQENVYYHQHDISIDYRNTIFKQIDKFINKNPQNSDDIILIAKQKFQEEDNFSLMQLLDKYKITDRNQQEFYLFIGFQQYKLKNYDLAIKYIKKSDRIKKTFQSYLAQGLCLHKLKKYDKGLKKYLKAYEIKINNDVNNAIAKIYLVKKDYDKAKKYYNQSLCFDYNQLRPLRGLSECYLGQKKYCKALYYIEKHLAYSQNFKSYILIGTILQAQRNFQRSIEYYLKCFKIKPNDFDVNSDLAALYYKIHDKNQSDFYRQRCSKLTNVQ